MRHSFAILLSGFLFFGQYFDSTLLDLEGREVKYRAGIRLDLKTFDGGPILFVEDETYLDKTTESGFHPIQTNYKIGLSQRIGDFEAIFKHECLHPVDGYSRGAKAQDYSLVELRYHFK